MKPSIGRIVHFKPTDRAETPSAAIIIGVNGVAVDLNVLIPGAVQYVRNATEAADFASAKGGQWCWPEQV